MTASNASLDENQVARLLDESRWLSGLARRLVLDPGLAEDLAQETMMAALGTNRQPEEDRVRGWLSTILRRKLATEKRNSTRRAWREQEAAPGEALPGADDVAEILESEQLLRDSLAELTEPYRRALTLRYREGLSAAEIARRDGEPAGTVRSRLHTGLGLLRQKLEARDRDWRLALAPLTRLPGATAAAVAPVAAGTKGLFGAAWIAAALLAAVALPVGLWLFDDGSAANTVEPPIDAVAAIEDLPDGSARAATPPKAAPATRVAAAIAPTEVAAPRTEDTELVPGIVELVVVDENGQPIAGAHAERWDNDVTPRYSEDSGANGLLSIQLPSQRRATMASAVNLRAPGRASVHLELTFRAGTTTRHDDVVLPLGASLRGTAHDPLSPDTVFGVVLVKPLPESFPEMVEASASLDELGEHFEQMEFLGSFQATDPATGEFLIADVPPGTRGQVLAVQDDRGGKIGWSNVIELAPGETLDLDPILIHTFQEREAAPAGSIVARIVLPEGADPDEFRLSAGWYRSNSWHNVDSKRRSPLEYLVPCKEGQTLSLSLTHANEEYLTVSQSGVTLASKVVTLEVAPRPEQDILVVTSDGEPAADFDVTLLNAWRYEAARDAPLATIQGTAGACTLPVPVVHWKMQITSGDEMATLGLFRPGEYDGPETVKLKPSLLYRGTLTDGGSPVASANLTLRSLAPTGLHGMTGELLTRALPGDESAIARTGPDGEFEFDPVPEGSYALGVEVQDVGVAAFPLGEPEELELTLPATGSVQGQVIATHGEVKGGIVTISHELGLRHSVAYGADGRFNFTDLCEGEWYVGETYFQYKDSWLGEALAPEAWQVGDIYYSSIRKPRAFTQRLGESVQVAAGATSSVQLDIREQPEVQITGTLTVDGRATRTRKITFFPSYSLGSDLGGAALMLHRTARAKRDGTFSTALPMGGAWKLRCGTGHSEWVFQADFTVAEGAPAPEPLTMSFETGKLVLHGPTSSLPIGILSKGAATGTCQTSAYLAPDGGVTGRKEISQVPAGEIEVYRLGKSKPVPLATGTLAPGGTLTLDLR